MQRFAFKLALVTTLLLPSTRPLAAQEGIPPELRTFSERSGWTELTPHDEVVRFYHDLVRLSPDARMREIGESREGRPLMLVTLSRPAVAEPWEAHASGKPVFFIGAQVHGDEHAGKEGLMVLARDLAFGELSGLLDQVVFVLVPQINPDGGEAGTWGTRTNRGGYNINRDYARLVNPEVRAIVQGVLLPWRPHVGLDAHELTGPRLYDFYALHPSNINGPAPTRALSGGSAIQAVQRAVEAAGFTYFPYHLQPADPTRVPEEGIRGAEYGARILRSYGGVSGTISLLFESRRDNDPRVGIEPRVRSQRVAMEALARWTADNATELLTTIEASREEMRRKGGTWDPSDSIAVRTTMVSSGLVDYRMPEMRAAAGGGFERTGRVLDLRIPNRDSSVAVVSRVRPVGYVIEARRGDLVDKLRAHGIQVERILGPVEVRGESFRVDSVRYEAQPVEGYHHRDVWTTAVERTLSLPAGAYLVRATQPLATLAFVLLEPEDIDSFASVGEMATEEQPGTLLSVHRLRELPRAASVLIGP